VNSAGSEEGLLGFTFHPEFDQNGRIFVNYTAAGPKRTVVSEFMLPEGQATVDPTSEKLIMEFEQPRSNHNGGMLVFGPDGMLYISVGDGGGAGDTFENGQDLSTIYGAILRIDVNAPDLPYAVPTDNPFTGVDGAAGEIWAYGFRNPWRIAFDPETGDLWASDVGQNQVEEVDYVLKGGNYGWNLKEGSRCYSPATGWEVQSEVELIDPVTSYAHDFGCSITGGYVYRGERTSSLEGGYVFGDFCSGKIWAIRADGGALIEQLELIDTTYSIPAFGQTLDGEVYVLTYEAGIQRFVAP
jgi:glucose/arabinose dehydrogenase